MQILVISDIHGNYPALQAVARDCANLPIKYVFNCGDSLVYAPFPNEAIDFLITRQAISILGNTDEIILRLLSGKNFKKPAKEEKRVMYTRTAAMLSHASQNYICHLKKKKRIDLKGWRIGLYHGSPADHKEFLFDNTSDVRFRELAIDVNADVVITGHSHTPYHKHIDGVHFINPGSVGRMFDGNPAASYALIKLSRHELFVQHYRIPYDVETVVAELQKQALPPIYEAMFRQGKKLN